MVKINVKESSVNIAPDANPCNNNGERLKIATAPEKSKTCGRLFEFCRSAVRPYGS